eukprot:4805141-Alexandrium_andersonii.AAC.1
MAHARGEQPHQPAPNVRTSERRSALNRCPRPQWATNLTCSEKAAASTSKRGSGNGRAELPSRRRQVPAAAAA